ncbi:MAG: uroporphyrinogen decarboxylase family protein [Thermomicrobiales bacterium]
MTERQMTSRERVAAATTGDPVDRPPLSIWQHFPERDQTADSLTAATMEWQNRYRFDLVKFMPPGDYPTIDWGLTSEYTGAVGGTRAATRLPINDPADWPKLNPIDVTQGFNGIVLDALAKTRQALDPNVPLLHTVFSPLTIAMKLSGGRAIEHLRAHPAEMHQALAVIRGVTSAMVTATFEVDGDGLFFATQCADHSLMDEVEYREFGMAYDLPVLEAAPADAIVMCHFHGETPMFHLASRYPAQIINWHDRHAAPPLAEGCRQSGKSVAGGINERAISGRGPEEAAAEAADAVTTMQGRSLIVAPGCVVPIDTPDENIRAVIRAVAPDHAS